jgi:FtsZ-binding cell division protein ZapB
MDYDSKKRKKDLFFLMKKCLENYATNRRLNEEIQRLSSDKDALNATNQDLVNKNIGLLNIRGYGQQTNKVDYDQFFAVQEMDLAGGDLKDKVTALTAENQTLEDQVATLTTENQKLKTVSEARKVVLVAQSTARKRSRRR